MSRTSASSTILATVLGHFAPNASAKALIAASAWARSSASRISARAFFADGCADFGSAERTFAALWTSCRYRHKVHYAEQRIMPVGRPEALWDKGLGLVKSA